MKKHRLYQTICALYFWEPVKTNGRSQRCDLKEISQAFQPYDMLGIDDGYKGTAPGDHDR